jgi:hypothetical protein
MLTKQVAPKPILLVQLNCQVPNMYKGLLGPGFLDGLLCSSSDPDDDSHFINDGAVRFGFEQ